MFWIVLWFEGSPSFGRVELNSKGCTCMRVVGGEGCALKLYHHEQVGVFKFSTFNLVGLGSWFDARMILVAS